MIRQIFVLIGLFFCLSAFTAPIQKLKYSETMDEVEVDQWQLIDILFTAESKKPFDKEFGAIFTGAEGITMDIPGFYNGNNSWILRFSTKDIGAWSFESYSDVDALDSKTGAINIIANKDENQHGGIRIDSENTDRLIYEDGTPYFLMAFELDWLFAMDYRDKDLPKANKLLNYVKDAGVNHIVMNVYAYDVSWKKDEKLKDHPEHDYGSPDFFPFGGSNENPDFSTLNTEFFDHFDRTISLMGEKQIVSHLMIYVWNKLVNWPEMYSKEDNRYFEYVLKRYQAFPNLVWDISKEALFYGRCDEAYIKERIERVRKLDAYKRLLTVHDFGFCNKNADLVDYISKQDWAYDLYPKMIQVRNNHADKVVFNIEHGGYEESPYVVFPGSYTDAETCLRRNYFCAFAGTYSTYYWQATSWNVIVPDPFAPGISPQPKFEYYKHFVDLFTKYNFNTLEPHDTWGNGLSLKSSDNLWLYYCPKEQYSRHIWLKDKEGKFSGQWFNPLTGEYSDLVTGTFQDFKEANLPNNENDWIFILKKG